MFNYELGIGYPGYDTAQYLLGYDTPVFPDSGDASEYTSPLEVYPSYFFAPSGGDSHVYTETTCGVSTVATLAAYANTSALVSVKSQLAAYATTITAANTESVLNVYAGTTATVKATSSILTYSGTVAGITTESGIFTYADYQTSAVTTSGIKTYLPTTFTTDIRSALLAYAETSTSAITTAALNAYRPTTATSTLVASLPVYAVTTARTVAQSAILAYTNTQTSTVTENTVNAYASVSTVATVKSVLQAYQATYSTAYVESYLDAYEAFYGWAMNLSTGAVSKYEGFNFTTLGTRYACGPDGIYSYGGDTDNGTAIPAFIETGLMDFGSSHLKRVIDSYTNKKGGQLKLTVTTDVGAAKYPLSATPRMQNVKANLGRGAKGREWKFKLENVSGSSATVAEQEFNVEEHSRRI